MFGLGYQEALIILLILIVPAALGARVGSRAGFSWAWVLLLWIAPLHLLMLWIFAFSRWPALDPGEAAKLPRNEDSIER
jgi:hypothetical protein